MELGEIGEGIFSINLHIGRRWAFKGFTIRASGSRRCIWITYCIYLPYTKHIKHNPKKLFTDVRRYMAC